MDIVVNGVRFPEPVGFNIKSEPVGQFRRNANGRMVGDIIAEKVVLNVEWAMLDDERFKVVMGTAAPRFADVAYDDPTEGRVTREMIVTAQGGRLAYQENGKNWWSGINLVFTER
jgi:hypothetical protein